MIRDRFHQNRDIVLRGLDGGLVAEGFHDGWMSV